MNIIDFLHARITEDETTAREATPGPWEWWNLEGIDQGSGDQGPNLNHHTGQWETCKYYCTWIEPTTTSRGTIGEPGHEHLKTEPVVSSWGHDWNGVSIETADAEHIARHDPARVLAECKAKRAIITAHPITRDVVEVSTRIKHGYACGTCSSYGDRVEDNGYCDTLRYLAAVYNTHPDYQEDWTP